MRKFLSILADAFFALASKLDNLSFKLVRYTEEDMNNEFNRGYAAGSNDTEADIYDEYLNAIEIEVSQAYHKGYEDGVYDTEMFRGQETTDDPFEHYNAGYEDGWEAAELEAWDKGFEEGWEAAFNSQAHDPFTNETDIFVYDENAFWDDGLEDEDESNNTEYVFDFHLNPTSEAV